MAAKQDDQIRPDPLTTVPEGKWLGKSDKNRAMTPVSTDFYQLGPDPDEIQVIEGTLMEKGTQTFTRGQQVTVVGKYKVQFDDGSEAGFLGSQAIDDLLRRVEIGTYIRLAYTDTIQTKQGQKMKQFNLEVEK